MDSSLDAVDNITVSAAGEIFVCEDGGNMEIGLITPEREVSPFLRFTGDAHPVEGEFKSEVCGVIFDPSGTRLYCTSQRSYPPGPEGPGPGAVYEISGPFRQPATPGSGDLRAARGENGRAGRCTRRRTSRRPSCAGGAAPDRAPEAARRGLVVEVRAPRGAGVGAARLRRLLRARLRAPRRRGPAPSLARRRFRALERARRPRLRLGPPARRRLSRRRRGFNARLLVTARTEDGRRSEHVRRIRVLG